MGSTSFRYDDQVKGELEYIKEALNFSQTEAIREAIHMYYQMLHRKSTPKSAVDILRKSGFIGGFKGSKRLSMNYKQEIEKGWKKKHGVS